MVRYKNKIIIALMVVMVVVLSSIPVYAEATGSSFMDAITFKIGKWKTNKSQSYTFYYKTKTGKRGKYTFTLKNPEDIYSTQVVLYDADYHVIMSEKTVQPGETLKKKLKLGKKKWYYIKVTGHCKFKLKK